MEMRRTSLEAWREIRDKGLLSPTRMKVLECLVHVGPMTGGELNEYLKTPGRTPGFHKRLPELRDAGVVREAGQRPCSVTGHSAIVWEASGLLPNGKPLESPPARRPSLASLQSAARLIKLWEQRSILHGEAESADILELLTWIDALSR